MKITLVPTAGLCNRINAITSGILFQQKSEDIFLDIYWEKTSDCFADFDELFEQPKAIEIKKLTEYHLKPGTKKNLYIPDILKFFYFDSYYYGYKFAREEWCQIIQNQKNVYVASYNPFTPYEITSSLAEIFRPIEELRKRISKVTETFGDKVIGVHIRRTDNIEAIQNNPLNKFISLMNNEIELNKEIRFYLATDSEQIKTKLKNIYGSRIITLELSLFRNDTKGMKDAVVDLYCLASTKKIIGCTNSTYSTTASRLYNVDLII